MAGFLRPKVSAVRVRFAQVFLGLLIASCCACQSGAPHPVTPDNADPGSVAVQFTQLLYSGEFAQAGKLVSPASVPAYQAVTEALHPGTSRASGLKAGNVRTTGTSAEVVILGELCSGVGAATPTAAPVCITNTDPRSSNPIFTVRLTPAAGSTWLVVFIPPTAPATESNSP